MSWGRLTIFSLCAFFCLSGWGSEARLQDELGGQPAVCLHLTAGSQTTEPINLAGARNEHVFFLVLVEGASSSLRARLEGLTAGLEAKLFRVVAVPPTSAGKYPADALLPLGDDYSGLDSEPLPLWVSLKIAPDCPPGSYTFHLVITDRDISRRLPVKLRVFRFALPEDLPLTIFAGFWHQPDFWSRYDKGSPASKVQIIKRYYQSLREYKINALGGSYPLPLKRLPPGQQMEDFPPYHELLEYALDELKFAYFQIPRLKGWQTVDQPESPFVQQTQVFFPDYGAYLRRHGWENRALNYLVDEPQQQGEAVVRAYARAKALIPRVRTLCAGWHPRSEFAKVIDIWSFQAAHFREDDLEQARRRGQEAWLYANRLHTIGSPLSHPRLIGWLLYRYHFSGYLLWGVNFWPQDPWTTSPGPKDFYRRGTFYYPHPQTGLPLVTTRLEALRRGLQDYQYLLLLDRACRRGLVPLEDQEALQAEVRRFTANLARSSFPVSMAELEAVRLRIGQLLDGISDLPQNSGAVTDRPWPESHTTVVRKINSEDCPCGYHIL
jgi:hypothetical protein